MDGKLGVRSQELGVKGATHGIIYRSKPEP